MTIFIISTPITLIFNHTIKSFVVDSYKNIMCEERQGAIF